MLLLVHSGGISSDDGEYPSLAGVKESMWGSGCNFTNDNFKTTIEFQAQPWISPLWQDMFEQSSSCFLEVIVGDSCSRILIRGVHDLPDDERVLRLERAAHQPGADGGRDKHDNGNANDTTRHNKHDNDTNNVINDNDDDHTDDNADNHNT